MTIDDFLADVPEPQAGTLGVLRAQLRELLPDAEETIAYGAAVFRTDKGLVAGFTANAKHCAYLPMSGTVLSGLAERLTGYTYSKGALRFPPDQPLPRDLVEALVAARLAELP
jgi:uncharacterized protein YdhG (YjbR/CyaY superfamily)